MNFILNNKKILSYIVIIPIIISLSFSGLTIKMLYAANVTEVATPVPVSDHAMRSKYVGITIFGHTIQVLSLNSIAILVAKTILAKLTDSIVEWINSGFEGSPSFVGDPKQFLIDTADEIAGEFINSTEWGWVCDPYKLNIKIALSLGMGRFKRQKKCTLTKIINNFNNFFNGTFKEGGWKGWFAVTANPNEHPGSAFLSIQAELDKRIAQGKDMEVKKLDWGKGFLSWRDCLAYSSSPATKSDSTSSASASGSVTDNTGKSHTCEKWSDIKTPGTVIESQLEHSLGTGVRQLEIADDIDMIVGALVGQLVKTVLQKGLSSLQSSEGWSGVSSDLEEKSSKTKMTVSCIAYDTRALTGDNVEWVASVSGGPSDDTPTYTWSINNNIDEITNSENNGTADAESITVKYNTTGKKTATVKVEKGNKSAKAKCSNTVKVSAGDDSDTSSSDNAGYCFANKSAIRTGNSVKWTWSPYSSDSSYDSATYEWSGDDIEDAGSGKSITVSYSEAGEKSAEVIVTKDGESSSYDCGAVSVSDSDGGNSSSETAETTDYCSVNKTSAFVNQTVKWTLSLADDDGTATYKWKLDDVDESVSTKSVEVAYGAVGTKTASVDITKNDITTTLNCKNSVKISSPKLTASCDVNPIAGVTDTGEGDGTEFTWTAMAEGGESAAYVYSWSGSDSLSGDATTTSTTYSSAGNKTAKVTVTSGEESVTVKCDEEASVFSQ